MPKIFGRGVPLSFAEYLTLSVFTGNSIHHFLYAELVEKSLSRERNALVKAGGCEEGGGGGGGLAARPGTEFT